jgi:hypothetical protein
MLRRALGAWALLAACALSACILGGQTGQNSTKDSESCERGRTRIASDQVVPGLGFSAASAAAPFTGPRDLELRWQDGGEPQHALLSLEYDAPDAVHVERECTQRLELAVVLTFHSDDGQLSERVPATLIIDAEDRARLSSQPLALSELQGSYDGQADGAGELRDGGELRVAGSFERGALSGVVELLGTPADGGDPVSIVVASWQAAP